MNSNDMMLGLSIGGLALSVLFCIAECRQRSLLLAAERTANRKMRAMYAKIFSVEAMHRTGKIVVRSLTKLNIKKNHIE